MGRPMIQWMKSVAWEASSMNMPMFLSGSMCQRVGPLTKSALNSMEMPCRRRNRPILPSTPPSTSCLILALDGSCRIWYAIMNLTPARCTASAMRSQSARASAMGFWHRMCFPAAAAATAISACRFVSQVMITP